MHGRPRSILWRQQTYRRAKFVLSKNFAFLHSNWTKLMSGRRSLSVVFRGWLHDDCRAANLVSFHSAIEVSVIRQSNAVRRFVFSFVLAPEWFTQHRITTVVSSKFLYTVPLCVNEVIALRTATDGIWKQLFFATFMYDIWFVSRSDIRQDSSITSGSTQIIVWNGSMLFEIAGLLCKHGFNR